MRRAAIYARFSTDLQNDRSVEDQVASCRALAEREGLQVVSVYEDRARSGSTMHGRPGIRALLAAAAERQFDVLICESMSRAGRDQEDRAAIRKRLEFSDIAIMTVADGLVTHLTDGIRAVIDSQQLADQKVAIRRGMSGVIRDGRHCGGAAYGYRAVKGEPGQLEIVEAEKAIIQRIYVEFIAGDSPRDIAGRLNAEGIAPPRGAYWRASTINGDGKRAFGILRNELYLGRLIWNKTRKVRHPDTGKRLTRLNPETEWVRIDAPHLRIIDDETFAAAQARRGTPIATTKPRRKKSGRLLSGLLRCGCCGAGMSLKDVDHGRPRIVCTQMREARSCANRTTYYLDTIEKTVVAGLRGHLGTPEAIAHYIDCYNDERRKLVAGLHDDSTRIRARLATLEREIERTVSLLVKGLITETEAARHLPALRAERDQCLADIEATGRPADIVQMDKSAVAAYLASLDDIDEAINAAIPLNAAQFAAAIGGLIETVTVEHVPAGSAPTIEVSGRISNLIGGCGPSQTPGTTTLHLHFGTWSRPLRGRLDRVSACRCARPNSAGTRPGQLEPAGAGCDKKVSEPSHRRTIMNQVAMLFGAILALSAIVTLSPADAQVRDHRNGVADQDQRPGPAAGNGPRLGRAHGGVIVTGSPMHGKRR